MPRLEIANDHDTKLDSTVQAKVFQFLMKLREDDTSPGLHIEKMAHQKDPRARTGRVDRNWRALLFVITDDDGERRYLYAGTFEHDEACDRARTRVLRSNPVTNVAEIITATTPSLPVPRQATTAAPVRRARVRSYLGEHGYPVVDMVQLLGFTPSDAQMLYDAADADELLLLADRFENAWQRMATLGMAAGDAISTIRADLGFADSDDDVPPAAPADEPSTPKTQPGPEPGVDMETEEVAADSDAALTASLRHPASRMQFTLVNDDEELERVLSQGDFGAWRTFLHPQQRRYALRRYNGPFRLTGGAGTGKTVVLLHRAHRLATAQPQARVVLTTYTKALATMLTRDLLRLDEATPLADALGGTGVLVKGIDALAMEVRRRSDRHAWDATARRVVGRPISGCHPVDDRHGWDDAVTAVDTGLREVVTPTLLQEEYVQVILPHRISSVGDYLTVRRPGRGVRLNRRHRMAVWKAVEAYRVGTEKRREYSWAELSTVAASHLAEHPEAAPADHVLVDEGQDLSPLHWQLVRALAAPGPDDIFLAEDVHQRIYGARIVLSRYGIATVGRSRRLRLNYRTTWENLRYALGVIEGAQFMDAAAEVEDTRGYRSARRGPAPRIIECENPTAQAAVIATQLEEWRTAEPAGAFAVLGRTTTALRRLKRNLDRHGVTAQLYGPDSDMTQTQLVTMHSAKGLEFSRVILYDVSDGSIPLPAAVTGAEGADRDDALLRERSLLYVAATRARDEVVITWSGAPSPLLQ